MVKAAATHHSKITAKVVVIHRHHSKITAKVVVIHRHHNKIMVKAAATHRHHNKIMAISNSTRLPTINNQIMVRPILMLAYQPNVAATPEL